MLTLLVRNNEDNAVPPLDPPRLAPPKCTSSLMRPKSRIICVVFKNTNSCKTFLLNAIREFLQLLLKFSRIFNPHRGRAILRESLPRDSVLQQYRAPLPL